MGNLSQETLDTTVNQSLGMVIALPKGLWKEAQIYFQSRMEAWRVGQVISGKELVFV
jgi:phosphoribosylaminoimidazole (AIR) synthetase